MTATQPLEASDISTAELMRLGDGGRPSDDAGKPAHARVTEACRRWPTKIAVASGAERLTYGELDAQANRLATELRARGVGPEAIVGVCLPRRASIAVAVLAVMRAGGAYLPLDPGYPTDRRRFMLEDAGASVLITTPEVGSDLSGGQIPTLDPRTASVDGGATDRGPERSSKPSDLAYVMYTSGSTGRPKGVMVEHRGLAGLVDWALCTFSREELSSVLASTSIGFDISLFEIFGPLASGGRMVIADNLFGLRDMRDEPITLVNTVPSLISALLQDADLPPSVTTVVLAGEPLPREVADAVHRQPGVRRLVNAYGPTEDTVYSTFTDVEPGTRPKIGRPLPGTHAYVLDPSQHLMPRGAAGELCLAGAGIARGYCGREDLTAERFITAALPGQAPVRVYRTGDLAQWEPDGSLRHLGRIDDQIKLHGVRIEPGEIEGALLRHPSVRQSAVVARERTPGELQLIAYAVCDPSSPADGRSLRDFLRSTLPSAMVPSAVLTLDEMPLTPNGKLDRNRLPAPGSHRSSAGRTGTEQGIAELWREILELETLPDPQDDFFEIGGHSLAALQLLTAIEDVFGRHLPADVLIEDSTLNALAEAVESGNYRPSRLAILNRGGTRVPCVYVHAGAGGVFTLRRLSAALGHEQPFVGIQGFLGRERSGGRLRQVEEAASESLEILREVQPQGPYILTGHSAGGAVAFEMAGRLQSDGEEILLVGLLDPPASHTLRLRGRLAARMRELAGIGPEPRRADLTQQVLRRLRHTALSQKSANGLPELDVAAVEDEAWLQALEGQERIYRPKVFRGKVVVFQTAETARYTGSATLGWDRYVDGQVESVRVPGDHMSMLLDPHAHVLARELATRLDEVQQLASPVVA